MHCVQTRVDLSTLLPVVVAAALGAITCGRAIADSDGPNPATAETSKKINPFAPAAKQDKASNARPKHMAVEAVLEDTGEPIQGVELTIPTYRALPKTAPLVTDKDGKCTITLPRPGSVPTFDIEARKPGLVPERAHWSAQGGELKLPECHRLVFQKGTTIGGTVRNEAGDPLANASIKLYARENRPDGINYYAFIDRNLKTDSQGRWRCDMVPDDFDILLNIEHADYLRANGNPREEEPALRDQTHVATLARGLKITGRVLGPDGQPLAGASLLLGQSHYDGDKRTTKTGEDGRFELVNCKAGQQFLCVEAGNYAPQFEQITVDDVTDPIEFRLQQGARFRLRFVDEQGQPIPTVEVAISEWRQQQLLTLRKRVDREGRFDWKSGPHEEIRFDFLGGPKHLTVRRVPLEPSDNEETLTLPSRFTVSGSLTDAATGKPIEAFKISWAQVVDEQADWFDRTGAMYTDGRFKFQFDELKPAYKLRFQADGYRPVESKTFTTDDYPATLDVELKKEG